MLRTLCQSDCLILRPPFAEALAAGARVSIIPLFGGIIST
jgi:molybdopterin biosynthesis enzyme